MKNNPVKVIADAMLEKKGQRVVSLDLRKIDSSISDYFIVCNADSTTNVAAIADNILVKMMEKCERKVIRMQGLENDFWVILDFGEIVVHVFLTEYREFYRLEDLWADAAKTEYNDEPVAKSESTKRVKPKASAKVRASVRKKTAKTE